MAGRLKSYRTALPPAEELAACFVYDGASGTLHWKWRAGAALRWNRRFAGARAGCVRKDGYLCVQIQGKQYAAHRVIWKLVTGEDPNAEIDHVDGDRTNNTWENLRSASASQNRQNSRARGDYKKGVYLNKHGAYVAQLKANGENIYLGSFATEMEAHAAYSGAAAVLFKEFRCVDR